MAKATVPPPLSAVIPLYLATRRGQLAASTLSNTCRMLLGFTDFVGPIAPGAVTCRDVERFVGRGSPSPGYRRRRLSTLRSLWRWLILEGHAKADPTAGIPSVREPRRLPRGLRPDQVAAVLVACPDARARLVVLLEARMGLRACEVARLRLEDVDFPERTMLVSGKGGHERVLPIPSEVWDGLATYLAEHPATRGPLVRNYDHPDRGICAAYVAHAVKRWMQVAGVPGSGHALRHSFAGAMLRRGVDLRTIQAALGHANIAVTDRYLPTLGTPLREAMEGVGPPAGPDLAALVGAQVERLLPALVEAVRAEMRAAAPHPNPRSGDELAERRRARVLRQAQIETAGAIHSPNPEPPPHHHTLRGRHICPGCGQTSSGPHTWLAEHWAKRHDPCPDCGRSFVNLGQHRRRAHAAVV